MLPTGDKTNKTNWVDQAMKTTLSRVGDNNGNWIVIDATNAVAGRLASFVAKRLRGKHRRDYTPHIDGGDNVIVVNAGKVRLTGQKRAQKTYFRHTGYPGGIKSRRAEEILDGRFPDRIVRLAVQRMMPKESAMARLQLSKLYVYAQADHPHEAQKPRDCDFTAMNPKNIRKD